MQRILIQPFLSGWRCALLKDGKLADFSFQYPAQEKKAQLDDIVCGRITAIRNDFVWFTLGLNIEGVAKTSLFHKQKLCEGRLMWLQIIREPWPEVGKFGYNEKGYRLTPNITLAGHYWVYNPLSTPKPNSKWIRRSAATDMLDDCVELSDEKKKLTKQAEQLLTPPIKIGIADRGFTQWQRWVRDSSNDLVVTCETPLTASYVKEWIKSFYPEKSDSVRLARQTESPLFEHFGIEDRWAEILTPHVILDAGCSIDIRELPAATLIDVNAGTQCDNVLDINMNALKSIEQQIRWRNISGNILIDFIRLTKSAQNDFVKSIRNAFKNTDVRVLGFCELGLLQLQRTRYRPSLFIKLMSQCPQCHGDGFVGIA
ncbi:MAG: ribonuclease E/G [Candidatus Paracaedibacteraceae bacterium]|nr:ribonuclease E/G [Candidatus Paracaedibacteraceae bacterium]